MASTAITIDDIKIMMGIKSGTDSYDGIIPDKIASAYAILDDYTGYDREKDDINSYEDFDGVTVFCRGIAKDIVLKTLKIDGVSASITTDISQVSNWQWKITNTALLNGAGFYVSYTSANLTARIKDILKDIIIFELNKLPAFNNSISIRRASVDNITSQEFVSDDYFYGRIREKLEKLFVMVL